jgi:hypothetical protein
MDATSRPSGIAEPELDQVELVVDLIEVVYQANGRMAAALDRLTASRASVSDACIEAFLRLAEDLRPGAAARARLACVDNETQIAGAAAWIARRRQLEPGSDLLPATHGTRSAGAAPARSSVGPHVHGSAVGTAEGAAAISAAARAIARWRGAGGPR